MITGALIMCVHEYLSRWWTLSIYIMWRSKPAIGIAGIVCHCVGSGAILFLLTSELIPL